MKVDQLHIAFLHFWTLRLHRGVETLTLSLANELARSGVDTSLVTARRTLEPLVAPDPAVRIFECPTFRYFETSTIVPFYTSILYRQKFDVVVTYFADYGEGLPVQLSRALCKFRHVLYLTFPFESAPHRYHAYRRWGWQRSADLVLADAAYTARAGEEYLGRPVQLLPSGTDPQRFRPDPARRAEARRRLGFREDEVVLLNVSALEKRKGTWRVIEALPGLLERCPNVRYLVLGKGDQEAALRQQVQELGLGDVVVFGGTTPDLPPYYNAADIFVMLSDSEAGSVALLEAMASGLPVLASDAGGFREVVDDGSGWFSPLDSPARLVELLEEAVRDPTGRACRGQAARQAVIDRFSWSSLANQLVRILETGV